MRSRSIAPPRTAASVVHFPVSPLRSSAAAGVIPDTVRYSFWAGGAALFAAVLWTVLTTKEYSPEEMAAFAEREEASVSAAVNLATRDSSGPFGWIMAGAAIMLIT